MVCTDRSPPSLPGSDTTAKSGTMCGVPPSFVHDTAFTRRGAFRILGASAVSCAVLASTTGCAREEITGPALDSLTAQLRSARADAVDAGAAIAVVPDYATALAIVRDQRIEHADALAREIARAVGATADPTADGAATPTTEAAPTTPGPPPPDLDGIRERLTASARSAAAAAREESGYRAGLLGSISASCTVAADSVLS